MKAEKNISLVNDQHLSFYFFYDYSFVNSFCKGVIIITMGDLAIFSYVKGKNIGLY